jgi:hypothetical protein
VKRHNAARLHKHGCVPDPAKHGAPRMRKGTMSVLGFASPWALRCPQDTCLPRARLGIVIFTFKTLIFPARALRLSRLLHAKCLNGSGEITGDGTGVAIALGVIALGVSGGGALSSEPVYLARNLGN